MLPHSLPLGGVGSTQRQVSYHAPGLVWLVLAHGEMGSRSNQLSRRNVTSNASPPRTAAASEEITASSVRSGGTNGYRTVTWAGTGRFREISIGRRAGGHMTTGNENLIRRAYEAYARGDLTAMLAVVDPDLEWTYLDPAFPNPDPQICHGRAQLADGLRRQARRGLKSHVEDVIGNADKVLVTVRTPGADQYKARPTGDLDYDVLTVRDGRVVALRACRDRAQALAVLGLPGAPT